MVFVLVLVGALPKPGLPGFIHFAFFRQGQVLHFHALLAKVLLHFL